MKIRTTHVRPPIPTTRFDWSAIDDDTYEPGKPVVGFGRTVQEAIADLLEQIKERADD